MTRSRQGAGSIQGRGPKFRTLGASSVNGQVSPFSPLTDEARPGRLWGGIRRRGGGRGRCLRDGGG
jgi:hypothetical protein